MMKHVNFLHYQKQHQSAHKANQRVKSFLYSILSIGISQLSRYKIKIRFRKLPLPQFMQFQSEKFFFVQTLFHIYSTPQITDSYLLIDHDPCQGPIVDNYENIDFFSEFPKDEDTSQLRQIQEISPVQIEKLKPKKHKCHCKKTRCLKMYCECFSQGISCTKDCVCIGCHNNLKNQGNEQLKRKHGEIRVVQNIGQITQRIQGGRGCNCKKSQCQKKYCECRNGGVKCGQACHCVQCKNSIQGMLIGQKYNSSSVKERILVQVRQQENSGEWGVREGQQTKRKEEMSFIVMSNELLAQIDGYITA